MLQVLDSKTREDRILEREGEMKVAKEGEKKIIENASIDARNMLIEGIEEAIEDFERIKNSSKK